MSKYGADLEVGDIVKLTQTLEVVTIDEEMVQLQGVCNGIFYFWTNGENLQFVQRPIKKRERRVTCTDEEWEKIAKMLVEV